MTTAVDAIVEKLGSLADDVKATTSDPEAAHGTEDRLMRDALQAIADGKFRTLADARRIAAAGLATADLDMCRWYA